MVLSRKEPLWLDGRPLRVEPSQAQRRLSIRIRHYHLASELAFWHGLQQEGKVYQQDQHHATIQVRVASDDILRQIEGRPGWTLHWIDNSMTRQSGMVQINFMDDFETDLSQTTCTVPLVPAPTHYQVRNYVDDVMHATHRCIFMGRLNPRQVTIDLLHERMSQYGFIQQIRLAIGTNLIDAHAFILFKDHEAVQRAIAGEHGTVFLGQTLKVEMARR